MTQTTPPPRRRSLLTPPAFDRYGTFKVPAVERAPGDAGATRTAGQPSRRARSTERADLLIIGNGIAGCIAAIESRRYAPDATIRIVTEQNHPTINTPALKQFGAGKIELEGLLAYPPGTERELDISIVNSRVTRLAPDARLAHLANGQELTYERVLLATGSRPVGLPADCPGRDFDGVVTLHTLHDYLDLRRRLAEVPSAVVIGGGFHAAETAMLLRHARLHVTWLIRGRTLVPQQLDTRASDMLLRHVQRQGVEIRLETEVAGIIGRLGVAAGILTTDDDFIPAQLVVAATGVRPSMELVAGTGLAELPRIGLKVNSRLQTNRSDVYAAGAVAAVHNPQTGARESRAQWYFAYQQGRLAAAALTGAPIPSGAEAGAMGAFWHATQFDKLGVLAAGAPMLSERDDSEYAVYTNGASGFYRRIVVRHNRLVGYLALGGGQLGGIAIKRLVDEQVDIREIQQALLGEDFDARAFFTRRKLYALQTGQSTAASPMMPAERSEPGRSHRFRTA